MGRRGFGPGDGYRAKMINGYHDLLQARLPPGPGGVGSGVGVSLVMVVVVVVIAVVVARP